HPIGCTGSRIVTTLVYEMQKRKTRYGLATLCISGGMGIALGVERVGCWFSTWNSLPRKRKLDIGGMGERLKPAVLKTAVRGTVPGVRIPLPPFEFSELGPLPRKPKITQSLIVP